MASSPSPSSAGATTSAGRQATNGSVGTRPMAWTGWPTAPTGRSPVLTPPSRISSRLRSSSEKLVPVGGLARSSATFSRFTPIGRSLRPRPCTNTSSARSSSRSSAGDASNPTRVRPRRPLMPPTPSGPPISRGTSRPSTASTAILSPSRTASAGSCSHARASRVPPTPARGASSPGSSRSSASPTGSGPTTELPSHPLPWAASRASPSGGSSSASSRPHRARFPAPER